MAKITLKLNKISPLDTYERKPLLALYASVVDGSTHLKDKDTGEEIAAPFLKIPSKKDVPDYTDEIKQPISLHEIKYRTNPRKTKLANMPNLYEFVQMYKLMADNAATYNGEESLLSHDAKLIYEYAKDRCEEFAANGGQFVEPKSEKKSKVKIESDEEEEDEFHEETDNEEEPEEELEEEEEDDNEEPEAKSEEPKETEDDDIDYSSDLLKILRSVINYKSSHHKNSLKLSIPFMDPVDAREYPNYYTVVKKGMCFREVEDKVERGDYTHGKKGVSKFESDVRLIFANACAYNSADSVIYRDAQTLDNVFDKKMEKVYTMKREKRSSSSVDSRPRKRGRPPRKIKEEPMEEEEEEEEEMEMSEVPEQKYVPSGGETHAFIRKHEIEKVAVVEDVDDITAFIRRFTFSSVVKASTAADVTEYFEQCMIEPAGNSTVGGSTYSINLPGSQVIGQPLVVLVAMQNLIIDEKYRTELKVNKEILKPQPRTISYDDDDDKDGEFIACRYEFKLGLGLNLLEFKLRVPYPLKDKRTDEPVATDRRTTRGSRRKDDEDYEEESTDAPQQYFMERVKVWVKVA